MLFDIFSLHVELNLIDGGTIRSNFGLLLKVFLEILEGAGAVKYKTEMGSCWVNAMCVKTMSSCGSKSS